ncbi:MAG: hypothetical protein QME47_07565, partial [Candidatus Thermoplasmatota archaeon]|nr:hypothetical protein [Candidatus Thermoplasmatota archaeon]
SYELWTTELRNLRMQLNKKNEKNENKNKVRIMQQDCIKEVKDYLEKEIPRVQEITGKEIKEVYIKEGLILDNNNRHVCAATKLSNPPEQVYSCECWNKLTDKEKMIVVAHELAHAVGITHEDQADKIAEDVVKE